MRASIMRGRQLAAAFAIRQAGPGTQAARLVVTCRHTHSSTQRWPCEAGRLFQAFSSALLVRQRHNARSLVMGERGLVETRAIE